MKKLLLLFGLVLGSFGVVNAQLGRNPPSAPTPGVSPIDADRQKAINERSENLRMTEKFPVHTNSNSTVFRENIRPLYRDLKKDEKELLAPKKEDSEKYAEFLKQKNTDLIKLISDRGCDKDFGVIISSPHCETYSMPGAGASYSFRTKFYRMRQLGDVIFTGNHFQSVGQLTHGIFVNIGDVPLENVDLQTNGVSFLMSIAPTEDMEKADELTEKLISGEGIKNGEFSYQSIVPASENTTYILRSIAYRGNIFRTIQGMPYDELEFDKRREITVAFRVVRLEGEESVTILWKELDNRKSPKLQVLEDKS